jgi:hypothetical protein
LGRVGELFVGDPLEPIKEVDLFRVFFGKAFDDWRGSVAVFFRPIMPTGLSRIVPGEVLTQRLEDGGPAKTNAPLLAKALELATILWCTFQEGSVQDAQCFQL